MNLCEKVMTAFNIYETHKTYNREWRILSMNKELKVLLVTIIICCMMASPIIYASENGDYQTGDSVSTDMVEFTLNDCVFTASISLSRDNWLRPGSAGGSLVPGDDQLFIFFDVTIKNVSSDKATATDLVDVSVKYLDKYNYGDATYSDEIGWSSDSALSDNTGMKYLEPLKTVDVIGFIKCAKELRDNPNDVVLVVKLASESGEQEYDFRVNYDGFSLSGDAGAETSALLDALDSIEHNFEFVEKYAGNANERGSRKFADSFIEEMTSCFDGITVSSAVEQIPNLDNAVEAIKEKVKSVTSLLIDMGNTNSDANVPQMKEISNSALQDIITIRDAINGKPEAIEKLSDIVIVYTDQETIKKAQEALNAAGYDCGNPDGISGQNTKNAIQKFQEDHGLDVTGNVDSNLLKALNGEVSATDSSDSAENQETQNEDFDLLSALCSQIWKWTDDVAEYSYDFHEDGSFDCQAVIISLNQGMGNNGTYSINDGSIELYFQNGTQRTLPYTVDNSSLSLDLKALSEQ